MNGGRGVSAWFTGLPVTNISWESLELIFLYSIFGNFVFRFNKRNQIYFHQYFLYSQGGVWVHHLSFEFRPLPEQQWVVAATTDHHSYVNECKWVDHNEFWVDWVYLFYGPGDGTRKPPPIAVPAVAWTQAQVVNSNSTSSGKETRRISKVPWGFTANWPQYYVLISFMFSVNRSMFHQMKKILQMIYLFLSFTIVYFVHMFTLLVKVTPSVYIFVHFSINKMNLTCQSRIF